MTLSRFLTLGLAAFFAVPGPSTVSAAPSHYVFLDALADSTYAWTVTNWIAQYSDDDALCSYSESKRRSVDTNTPTYSVLCAL